MAEFLTTKQAAEALGVDHWKVRRLYERGDLPDPPRLDGKRVLTRKDLPRIAAALKARGWLKDAAPAPVAG